MYNPIKNANESVPYGSNNVFLGNNTGYSNTSGFNNVFLGNNAGGKNTSAYNNVFLGYNAGAFTTTGSNNVILGTEAGRTNTISSNNVFLGNKAGYTTKGTAQISGYKNPRTGSTVTMYNGSNNVFLGNEAGYTNSTGYNNVFLGNYAGAKNTTANNNVFLGYSAGLSNATGENNVFIGNEAGYSTNSTGEAVYKYASDPVNYVWGPNGSNNVFLGKHSGYSNTTGFNNVFLGNEAGFANTVGDNNVFIGYQTGKHTKGSNNILIGNYVDLENDWVTGTSTDGHNIMIGATTSYDHGVNHDNYIDNNSEYYLNIGDLIEGEIYHGRYSDFNDRNCGKLVVNGTIKAYSILPKFSNTNISHYYYRSTLGSATERWDTLYVGNINIGPRYGTIGGQIIGNLIPSTEGLPTEENTIVCQNLGNYNNTSGKYNLWNVYANDMNVYGGATFYQGVTFKGDISSQTAYGQLGCIYFTKNSVNEDRIFRPYNDNKVSLGTSSYKWTAVYATNSVIQTSDKRLKTNIKPLEKALDKVLTLNGVTYEWRVKEFPDKNFDSNRHVGVLAQEVEAVLPEAVETGEDGYKSVKYSEITPLLIEAMKEQQQIIDAQDKKIEAQQREIDELKAQMQQILEKLK